ncbi:Kinetochore protein Ndc80 [Artemisia annua]|uniref:Kinetochore protein NDC80 n=1 Tax=Artemisia annua TaxID=35608 RepID=A0A2U1M4U2_ARTAN|nr:Kinetochore protein Ndc80 [Artemisia annua]
MEINYDKNFNQGRAPVKNQNIKTKVGRRFVRKAKEIARKTGVDGLGDATNGISDVNKEFHEVEWDNDEVFKFGANHEGVEDNANSLEKSDVTEIQETKCGVVDEELVESIWGGNSFGFAQLPANGNSRGILLIWDKRVLTFKEELVTRAHSHRHNNKDQLITERSYQTTINNYLSFNKFPISLKLKPLPSNKDISESLKFVLLRLEYPLSNKLEEDLFLVLRFFNCPVKFNKSALKAPGTPHSFPSVLAVMHWLVQTALYNEHVVNSTNVISNDSMFNYSLTSYLHYIAGDDDAVDREDAAFTEKFEVELNTVKEKINVKAESKGGDLKKFNDLIEQLKDHEARAEKQMEEKEKALGVKVEERSRICAENEELKKKVEEQGFNMRDAERMKRELQAVERDIGEAEVERNKWEEKCWDLNVVIGTKWKELEALQIECNQAIRRLKLGTGFQYELNAKGLTPVEVLGDYKSAFKPILNSSIEEVKRTKLDNLESKVHLQQVSSDISAKIEAKENRIAILQSQIDQVSLTIIKEIGS